MSQPDLEAAMRTLATATRSPAPLPDADLVWRRAAARARWRQYELATRSTRLAERVAGIVCAVTGVVALGALDQALLPLLGIALAGTAAIALVLIKALSAEE
jgi:hypothetical protein